VRSPESRGWVVLSDLPKSSAEALRDRIRGEIEKPTSSQILRLSMSLAEPSERTTIYACPQCGVDGVFGYRNKHGDLIWYCGDHRLGRFWADARRDVVEPTFAASSSQPDQQHPPPLERFEHHCWCGKWGSFGYGVNLRDGTQGNWFCRLHRPRQEK
jgi:hypothetical protein